LKKKFLGVILASVIIFSLLAGCNTKKNSNTGKKELKETANYFYHTDLTTLNYLVDFHMTNASQWQNFLVGLFECDPQGNVKGAMARSWKVSKNGLTYTYQIRKGVKWIQADGSEYAEVKPSDFAVGLKYAADAKSQMLSIAQNSVKGLSEYIKGEDQDFSHVGIKEDDKKGTLIYTLNAPEPYWNSKLSQSIFFPINANFLKTKGKKIGALTPEGLLYNGPYILAEYTAASVIRMKANDAYYDKRNVHIKNVNLTFDSDKDPSLQYREFVKGEFSAAQLKPADASYKKIHKKNKDKICYMAENFSTYYGMFNFNRQSYGYTIENKDKEGTHKAIMNANFRKAILFSLNLTNVSSQTFGQKAGKLSIRHSLVPPNFVKIKNENYGVFLQKQMNDRDSVWQNVDFTQDGNNTSYKPELARQFFEKARKDLSVQGVQFPIHLDAVEAENEIPRINVYKSMKQSIESVLGKDKVVYDIHKTSKQKTSAATYSAETSQDVDYDFAFYAGWNADYQDPLAYLGIYDPIIGSMLHTIGLGTPDQPTYTNADKDIVQAIGLNEYADLLNQADEIRAIDKQSDRYNALAKAEAYFLNNVYIVPIRKEVLPCLLKLKPFSWSYSSSGVNGFSGLRYPQWKFAKLQDDIVTTKQYEKAQQAFYKKLAKSKMFDEEK
jgi:ABC-type oligopeptide transport system substrate-binding subunit